MSSFLRRAGSEIARLIARLTDPGGVANQVTIYTKDVAGVSQMFAQVSDGTIYQLTPFAGGATSGMLYGDGSDGNVTIAAGTTMLTKDMLYDTLTIQTAGILNPDGFRIFAKTAIVFQGTGKISRRGNAGADGLQATGGAGGAALSTTGRALPGSAAGGNGGSPTGSNGSNSGTSAPGNTQSGGNGGAGTGAGGSGGTSTPAGANSGTMSVALWAIEARPGGRASDINGPPGGGGGGGTTAQAVGGGGGSGGGYVVVCAPTITSTGLIESNGGAGGNCNTPTGSSGGGGGGGVGGDINCVCGDGAFPTLDASGGVRGTGKNGGANGVSGPAGTIRRYQGQ